MLLGCGTIAQAVLPMLRGHPLTAALPKIVIDKKDPASALGPAAESDLTCHRVEITPDNLASRLAALLEPGDLLLNLSVGIDSVTLADWCHRNGVCYLDTAIEPWEGYVEDLSLPACERTEYALHQTARTCARKGWRRDGPTALFTHGANPGLVSHFAKAALLEVAARMRFDLPAPVNRTDWATLAEATGTKVIHVSERDTQVSSRPKQPGEFVNTWSIPGFIEEAMMPVEIGWGSHETTLPADAGTHEKGPGNAIYLERLGAEYLLYSWVPQGGQILGLCLPHSETVTLSEYLTLERGGRVIYRPTVTFVYLPCDDAFASLHEVRMQGWREPEAERILFDDIVEGQDELGVLLLGHGAGGWWYGSQLDIEEARSLIPHSNPTALQVAAGVLSGAVWVLQNPNRGYCEPEDLPHDEVLDTARSY